MPSLVETYVTVLPETSKLADGIRRAFRDADPAVVEAARRWGREIDRNLTSPTVTLDADTAKAKAELDEAVKDRRSTVHVDVDRSALDNFLGGGPGGGSGIRGGFGGGGGIGPLKLNVALTGIGLLPAAGTAIAEVAGAIQQLAGAGAVLPGVFAGIMSSVGTAALGMHGMSDALKAVDKASDGTKASVDAANKALAGLGANQAETVKTVAGLKGTLTDLEHIAGQNMFAGFSGGLQRLVTTLLPATTKGIDGISRGINQNLLQAMQSVGSNSSQGFIDRIFGNTATAQSKVTAAIDPIVHAMGTLTAAGSDSLPRLADAVGKVAERFNAFISAADGDGRLQKWISQGLDGFTHLGDIVLNLGKMFTAITQAAGGGQGLLGALDSLTTRMSEFLNSAAGQQKLTSFFDDGRRLLGQLKDIAVELGPILGAVFNTGLNAANLWLPVIREILSTINAIPGGATAVVDAFLLWKAIDVTSGLLGGLSKLSTMLRVTLPESAAVAGAGMGSGLAKALPAAGQLVATLLAAKGAMDYAEKHKDDPNAIDLLGGNDHHVPGWVHSATLGIPIVGSWLNMHLPGEPEAPQAPPAITDLDRMKGLPFGAPPPKQLPEGFGPGLAPPTPKVDYKQWYPAAAPTVPLAPSTNPPVPEVSTYTDPVVTQPTAAGRRAASKAKAPASMSEGDANILAGVPAGRYTQAERGDLTKGLADCSSAVEDLVNIMQGRSTAGASMYTGNADQWLRSRGFLPTSEPVRGALNVGFNSEHMQATLPGGTNFNWGSDEMAAKRGIGGTGAFDPAFTSHYYLPGSGALAKGLTADNPMHVALPDAQVSKMSPAAQLGQDFVGGIAQMFGFDGSVFANPMNSGLFKLFKGAMGLKPGGGTRDAMMPATGGGGGLGGLLSGILPAAMGPLQSGSPKDAPSEFMPAMPNSGGGGIDIPAIAAGPPGAAGPGNSNDFSINFNGPVGNPMAAVDAANSANIPRMRQGLRGVPQ